MDQDSWFVPPVSKVIVSTSLIHLIVVSTEKCIKFRKSKLTNLLFLVFVSVPWSIIWLSCSPSSAITKTVRAPCKRSSIISLFLFDMCHWSENLVGTLGPPIANAKPAFSHYSNPARHEHVIRFLWHRQKAWDLRTFESSREGYCIYE